jgi:hypothetical protein
MGIAVPPDRDRAPGLKRRIAQQAIDQRPPGIVEMGTLGRPGHDEMHRQQHRGLRRPGVDLGTDDRLFRFGRRFA